MGVRSLCADRYEPYMLISFESTYQGLGARGMGDIDVLRPTIIRIGNRCYRKPPSQHSTTDEDTRHAPYYEDDIDTYEDEEFDGSTNVIQTDSGYRVILDVPSTYFRFIIGKKGETRRRIESETRTRLNIPKQGEDGPIVIDGRDQKGVLSAADRIDILVESGRQKQPFSHFLSLPMNGANIQQKLEEFKEDVLRFHSEDRGVDESLFQNPLKLHITIGTLALVSDSEMMKAQQLLQQCRDDLVGPVLRGSGLRVLVRGLEYMNDDPGEVDVLYAKVQLQDDSDRLQILADRLVDTFVSSGLMQKQYDRVKLHITVMNTLFRRDPSGTAAPSSGRGRGSRESFNAANILSHYKDYDFGVYDIDNVHLSQRYSTGDDGYYACTAKLRLT